MIQTTTKTSVSQCSRQNKNQHKLETFWTNIKGRWSYCAIKGTENNPLIICAVRDAIFWSGIDSFPFRDCPLSWHPLNQPNMTCLVPADNIDCAWMCNACYKLRTFPMQNRIELVSLVLYCQYCQHFREAFSCGLLATQLILQVAVIWTYLSIITLRAVFCSISNMGQLQMQNQLDLRVVRKRLIAFSKGNDAKWMLCGKLPGYSYQHHCPYLMNPTVNSLLHTLRPLLETIRCSQIDLPAEGFH